jgi:hypothetical protein
MFMYVVHLHRTSTERTVKQSGRVREPVQVYLDPGDRALLDAVAERSSLPRSEVLRVALRRLAADLPGSARPGASLTSLVGALDAVGSVPRDLAARHDEYLYALPARVSEPKPRNAPARTPRKKRRKK